MPSFVIYARKSSEEEDRQILSIPAQIEELRALAAARGIAVSRVFEESQSARKTGRPVFGEMMREVERRQIAGILCWKPDRLARNMVDGGRLIDALDRRVLQEIVTPGRTTRNSSDDKFFLSLEFSMSKKYVDDLSDNVKRGNRAVLASGRSINRVPVGYLKDVPLDRRTGRGAGRTLIDPVRFPLMKQLFQRYLSGAYSVQQLYTYARDTLKLRIDGTRRHPGGPIGVGSLYKTLRNPFYAGFIRHGGELYRGDHEAILTKDEHDRVLALLGRLDAPRPSRREFAFVGLIRCGACGRAVTGEEHSNRHGTRYVYYRCTRRRVGNNVCTEPYVSEPSVAVELAGVLARLSIPERLLAFTWAKLDEEQVRRGESSAAVAEGLRKEIVNIDAQLERLTRMCMRGLLPEDEYVRNRMALMDDREKLRLQLEAPHQVENALDQALRDVLSLAALASSVFTDGTVEEQREVLGKVCASVKLAGRTLSIDLRPPFQLLAERLPAIALELGDSNPFKTKRISRQVAAIPARRGPRFTKTALSRKESRPNPQLIAPQNEKTAGLEPAILSWSALLDEVRTVLTQSDPDTSNNIFRRDTSAGLISSVETRCGQAPPPTANYTPLPIPSALEQWKASNDMPTFVTEREQVHEIIYTRLHHLPPMGYKIDVHNWRFEVDEEVAPSIRKAWELVAGGRKIAEVLQALHADGFRSPRHGRIGGGPLARKSLYNILNDPFYAGYVRDRDRFCKGFHQALISEETFMKVSELLSKRRKNWNRSAVVRPTCDSPSSR
jgi:site-specific DNA recombinase